MNNTITVHATIHYRSEHYNADMLYQKLCEIKPDVVLFEAPLEFDSSIMEWISSYIQQYMGIEGIALLHYLESYQADVRPYDMQGRNNYYTKSYFAGEDAFEKAYKQYFKSKETNKTALTYKRIIDKAKTEYGYWDKISMSEMNSPECDVAVEAFHKIFRASMLAIFALAPVLAKHRAAWLKRERYDDEVDKAMSKNILSYNKQYENKSMVVLCGYFHRYALINLLKGKQGKEGFVLN